MIRFVTSIPSVPLPDPLWYELLEEIAPGLPDRTLDLVEVTKQCEHSGITLLDYILYEHGRPVGAQYPEVRQGISSGLVVLLPERDLQAVRLAEDVPVVCYEQGHPREWVSRYPNRLWVTRFWFGGPAWLSYLGVEHLVFDAYFLLNRAWLGAFTRFVSWVEPGDANTVYNAVPDKLNELVEILRTAF